MRLIILAIKDTFHVSGRIANDYKIKYSDSELPFKCYAKIVKDLALK